MTQAEFNRTLQGVVRRQLREAEGRRIVAARRVAARRPYRAGLLTQLISAMASLTMLAILALAATLRWLFNQNNRRWAKEHGQTALRLVRRKLRGSREWARLNELAGDTGEQSEDLLTDVTGGAR